MSPVDLSKAYQNFFMKSDAGKYFMRSLNELVDVNHRNAEDTPDLSRDYMQRAKGNREVLAHISSVTTELKKGGGSS